MQDRYRIDSLLSALDDGIQRALVRRNPAHLTEPELTVVAVEALAREVNNGGYEQFFQNSSSIFIHAIVPSLKRIGCPEHAKIAADAIGHAGITEDMDPEYIPDHVEDLDEEVIDLLDGCDERYYDCEEDIEGLLFAYVEKHQAEIRVP